MIERISNLYGNRNCNILTFVVTASEVCVFVGVILYHRRLTTGLHNPIWRVPALYNVMIRKSFADIMKYLHLADKQNLTGV